MARQDKQLLLLLLLLIIMHNHHCQKDRKKTIIKRQLQIKIRMKGRKEKAVGSRTAAPPRPTKGRAGDERPDHKPTTEDAMATTSFFLEAIARPSSRKGVTEDDIGWMGPFLQVGGVPGRRL